MKRCQLSDLVIPVNTWNPGKSDPEESFQYIDLSAVDQETKSIVGARNVGCSDAPSRARQLVKAGDILVSTVRPNLNGVAKVPDGLNGATASTGFCVVRPKPELLDGSYLFHWVKSDEFIGEMVKEATGASYPAVSDRIVLASRIPLSPLPEQRRIAAILDQADALRAKRRETLALLDELQRGIFIEMFCSAESSSWPVVTIESIAEQEPGSIRTGPFGSQLLHSEFVDSGIAVLGIDNAVSNNFRWVERRFITDEKYRQLKRYTVRPGDVLITIMGTCGRCAVVPDDIPLAINTKHLCCISLNRDLCLPEFLHAYFLRHPVAQEYLLRTAKGAIMSGLNMGLIKSLPVALPPLERQRLFVSRCQAIQQLRSPHAAALTELDSLFVSLQHRAFRGEL